MRVAGTPARARALWIERPGEAVLREEALATPGPGEALVRALYSGISRGTERLVFEGRVPESERERMRAPFQAGEFPAPVKYGYANVGVVEEGPPGLRGRPVLCLYPHQSAYVVPTRALHPLPAALPPARAVLAPNLETAINAAWDGRLGPGDRVNVVGAGVVGALVAWLAAGVPGTRVTLIDRLRERAELARALGARFCLPGDAPPDADVVFHASASAGGLATALECAGPEARVVELSWYGEGTVPVPLGGAFHARRLCLVSSQVGMLPASRRARWDHARRMRLALELLDDPALDALVEEESPFEELAGRMASILGRPGLMHRVRYEDR